MNSGLLAGLTSAPLRVRALSLSRGRLFRPNNSPTTNTAPFFLLDELGRLTMRCSNFAGTGGSAGLEMFFGTPVNVMGGGSAITSFSIRRIDQSFPFIVETGGNVTGAGAGLVVACHTDNEGYCGAPAHRWKKIFTIALASGLAVGTNTAGTDLTINGGTGTGTAKSGSLVHQTGLTAASGSTAHSLSNRSYFSAKFVDLTESAATLFANIALAASKYLGAKLVCTVNADDGTDFQALTSEININAINKAGTVTATLTQVDGTTAASAGTLAVTYTAVANGNGMDIKANAVSSLTQTTLRCKWAVIALNSDDVGTTTPS